MKKTFILFFVIISAQDNPQIIRANYFEAKLGHSAKLEKGLKDHTDRFHHTLDHAVNIWEVIAVDRTGQFVRTTYPQGWADLNPEAMSLFEMLEASFGAGAGLEVLQSRSAAVEKYESEVLLFRADLSTPLA